MRGRVQMVISLDLDDDAADAIDQQSRPDQVGRDLMHAAAKERTFQRLAEARGGGIGQLRIWSHFQVRISRGTQENRQYLARSARFGEPDCSLLQSDCSLLQSGCGLPATGVAAMGDTD
jgi:hypothetical protein